MITLSLVLLVLAIVVWAVTIVRRARSAPFVVDAMDVVILLLLAFYFR